MFRRDPGRCGCYYLVPANAEDHLPGMLGISPEKRFLPQVMLEVHSIILSTTSRTLLRQTYTNPSATAAIPEATYRFPLYDGVSVVAFACRVGSRLISGVVKEKEKAKAVYDAARGRGETAGLFEQLPEASDVFTTRLGNIPAGSDVVVEIEYLGELKHDAQVDGIRFTIPTAIAARYGTLPQDLRLPDGSPAREDGGIRITVDVCMDSSSSIRGIQSPSHPISVSLGSLSTDAEDSAQEVSLSRASATLSQGSAELEKDFVLLVLCKDVATPKALLETHPTIPGQRALMVTLVPRFALPPSRPEIVFVADRSGSMRSNIPTLISALKVFLKSLPVGVKFNICSFGSSFTFLWPRSKTYDRSSLTEAVKHVEGFQADYGGTEILRPVQAALERRFMDLSLEVMLLTDGETWDQASLFQYLNKEVIGTRAPIRVFSLGIGSDVSHAFIEGIARAGNGFSQAVSEDERLDGKVVRMLKGGLSPHINDYNLEVKYEASGSEDGYEMVERVTDGLQSMMIDDAAVDPSQHQARDKPISLFDSTANPDGSPGADEADRMDVDGSARFSHLPDLRVPKLVQAPHRIPALFPFSRTVVYLLLSADACQKTPKSVVLRATSAHGPLELEMAVEVLDTPQETIHQLAARKLVGELEEGRGWIVEAKDEGGVPIKERFEGQFDDMVQREAVRLGVEFQVAGKWCSFVAVEVDEQALAEQARRAEEAKRKEAVTRPTPGNVFSGGQRPGRGPAGTGDALSSQASEDLDDGRSVASSAISTGTFVSDATAPVQTPSSRSRQSNLSSASLKESLRGIGNEKYLVSPHTLSHVQLRSGSQASVDEGISSAPLLRSQLRELACTVRASPDVARPISQAAAENRPETAMHVSTPSPGTAGGIAGGRIGAFGGSQGFGGVQMSQQVHSGNAAGAAPARLGSASTGATGGLFSSTSTGATRGSFWSAFTGSSQGSIRPAASRGGGGSLFGSTAPSGAIMPCARVVSKEGMSGPPAQPPAGSSAPEAGADQVQEESKAEGGDCDDEADEVMGCGLFESETEDGPQPLAKPVALHSPPAKAYPDLVSAASPRAPRLPPGSAPSPDADQRLAPPPKSRLTPPAPSPMGKEKKKAAPAVEIFKSMRVLKRRTEKPAAPTPALMTAVERLHMLIALQSFEGWWELDEALLQTVHVSGASIDSSAGKYGAGRAPEASRVLATALAIAFLENTHSSDRDAWELVADKARLWLDGAVAAEGDRRDVEALAASLIAAGTKAAGPPVGIL